MLVKLCTYCQINKEDFNNNLCLHLKYSKSKINIPWSKRAFLGSERVFRIKSAKNIGSVQTKQSRSYVFNYAVSIFLNDFGKIL